MGNAIVINEDRSSGSVEIVKPVTYLYPWMLRQFAGPARELQRWRFLPQRDAAGRFLPYSQYDNTRPVSEPIHREAGLHESRGAGEQLALGSDTSYTTVQQ